MLGKGKDDGDLPPWVFSMYFHLESVEIFDPEKSPTFRGPTTCNNIVQLRNTLSVTLFSHLNLLQQYTINFYKPLYLQCFSNNYFNIYLICFLLDNKVWNFYDSQTNPWGSNKILWSIVKNIIGGLARIMMSYDAWCRI